MIELMGTLNLKRAVSAGWGRSFVALPGQNFCVRYTRPESPLRRSRTLLVNLCSAQLDVSEPIPALVDGQWK